MMSVYLRRTYFFILKIISVITFITLMLISSGCSKENDPFPEPEGKIIVLMYHRIVNGEALNLYERSVTNLEADLNYLIQNNIKVLEFSDLDILSKNNHMPSGNSAILTFDDGDGSWYTLVRPLLLKYKMKATFFLWTNIIGSNSFITWQEIADMSNYTLPGGEHPFIFGSHTYNHTYLLKSKGNFSIQDEYNSFLDYELGRSKEWIEQYTPIPVEILSLPYGDGAGDADIISAAKRNGYKYIRTSIWGAIENSDQDLYIIPSLPMLDSTEPDFIGYYLGL
jgi:peptidoglycan/xylan/chitin deacetylase (PgdA/CDA1 family)